MQEIGRTVERLAQSNVSVLIQGETGTGKELVARAIHDLSARAKRPFIVVDPGALPATLIASQLFGHERGAFTGAEKRQEGAFELAHGGSIFLDEIGELPLAVQPALLGVLERRSFRRLGGKEDIQVDVRVIAATHRDLRAEANQGTFRADLYFRLAVARIEIPPLRERPEDIDPLVAHFAAEITGAPGFLFSEATMSALRGAPLVRQRARAAQRRRERARDGEHQPERPRAARDARGQRGGDPAVPRGAGRGAGGVRAQLPAPADRDGRRQRVRRRAHREHGPPVPAVAAAPSRPALSSDDRAPTGARPRDRVVTILADGTGTSGIDRHLAARNPRPPGGKDGSRSEEQRQSPSRELPVCRNLSLAITNREPHRSQHRAGAIVGSGQR